MKDRWIHSAILWLGTLLLQACQVTEIQSSHNLLEGKILTVVHGCSGFITYRNTIPPNTIVAAQRSLAEHADAVEMDVQRSADGALVVFHDGELEKQTTCSGCVGEMDWAALQDCRYKTRHNTLDGVYKLPLLDSMLAAIVATQPQGLLFLNTKHDSPCDPGNVPGAYANFAKELVGCIRQYGVSDRVIVESMSAEFLREVRNIAPELKLLFDDEDFERGMEIVRENGFLGLAISNGIVTEAQVRQAHAAGYWLGIWGVKVMADTRKAVQKGPEFIMTDDLLMLQSALKK